LTRVAPTDEAALRAAIADAADAGCTLGVEGGGTHRRFGADTETTTLSTRELDGIVSYEPSELILTARPGTPLKDIEAALLAHNQMFAFEPFDAAPLYGDAPGRATIGGVVAAGIAGPRRISAGATRDHVLGFRAVSGRGETFIAGGKVVKNVTGYDLPKLVCGSWGRLAVLTEITLKVLPRPESWVTLALEQSEPDAIIDAMSTALGTSAGIAAAAHSGGRTIFRIEGFELSLRARVDQLRAHLKDFGEITLTHDPALWPDVQNVSRLADAEIMWRVIAPASSAPQIVASLSATHAVRWLFDWGGGLIWIAADKADAPVRDVATRFGGHARLVRAPSEVRKIAPALQPQPSGIAALEARVRRAFDPQGVFETSRFIDAAS
jgi:glycolate oxidase FAD binding subunit